MIGASRACDKLCSTNTITAHAEIALQWSERIINTWNISSPETGSEASKKIADQISIIATRFVKGKVAVQVIIGGHKEFYTDLTDRIVFEGHTEFSITKLNSDIDKGIGIVVDKEKFSILRSGTISEEYEEATKDLRELTVPFVSLQDRMSKRGLIIIAAHMSINSKNGLKALANILIKLQKNTEQKTDIIASGTFNSNTAEIKKCMSSFLDKGGSLLEVPYMPQLVTKSDAKEHDQVAFLGAKGSALPLVLSESALSKVSQVLIQSMKNLSLSDPLLTDSSS